MQGNFYHQESYVLSAGGQQLTGALILMFDNDKLSEISFQQEALRLEEAHASARAIRTEVKVRHSKEAVSQVSGVDNVEYIVLKDARDYSLILMVRLGTEVNADSKLEYSIGTHWIGSGMLK